MLTVNREGGMFVASAHNLLFTYEIYYSKNKPRLNSKRKTHTHTDTHTNAQLNCAHRLILNISNGNICTYAMYGE